MRVRVRLFATLREIVGAGEMPWTLDDGASLGDLVDALFAEHPRLAAYRGTMLLAVNETYASRTTRLHDGDEVALLPPVSGGSR